MAVQLDYSIPRSVKIASNVPEPVNPMAFVSGAMQGLNIANMVNDIRRNKILDERQTQLFEFEKQKQQIELKNQEQLQKSAQIMQQQMQKAYNPETNLIDTDKLIDMQDFVLPQVYNQAIETASKYNNQIADYSKKQSEIKIKDSELVKNQIELDNQKFNQMNNELRQFVDNPIGWANTVQKWRQSGINIPEGIEGLQNTNDKLNYIDTLEKSFGDRYKQAQTMLEQQKFQFSKEIEGRKTEDLFLRRKEADRKISLDEQKLQLEQEKFLQSIDQFNRKQLTTKDKALREITDTGTREIGVAMSAGNIAKKISDKLDEISKLKRGPVSGYFLSKNPYDEELKEIQNYVTMLTPMLARGIFKEVGVLTDKDIERYQKLIPTIKDDPKVAKKITENLLNQINETYSIIKENYNMLGFDIGEHSKFDNLYELLDQVKPANDKKKFLRTKSSGNDWQIINGVKVRKKSK